MPVEFNHEEKDINYLLLRSKPKSFCVSVFFCDDSYKFWYNQIVAAGKVTNNEIHNQNRQRLYFISNHIFLLPIDYYPM